MFVEKLIDSLERFGNVLPSVVSDVSLSDLRWKPPSGHWSIQEIICHLADEEEFDFRVRVNLTLEDPSIEWPGIDPEGWAQERDYNSLDFQTQLDRFVAERKKSVAMLKNLDAADWNRTYEHPKLGEFRAGDIFAAWTAHDWLHLRQISKRLFEIATRDAEPFDNIYAGKWSA